MKLIIHKLTAVIPTLSFSESLYREPEKTIYEVWINWVTAIKKRKNGFAILKWETLVDSIAGYPVQIEFANWPYDSSRGIEELEEDKTPKVEEFVYKPYYEKKIINETVSKEKNKAYKKEPKLNMKIVLLILYILITSYLIYFFIK